MELCMKPEEPPQLLSLSYCKSSAVVLKRQLIPWHKTSMASCCIFPAFFISAFFSTCCASLFISHYYQLPDACKFNIISRILVFRIRIVCQLQLFHVWHIQGQYKVYLILVLKVVSNIVGMGASKNNIFTGTGITESTVTWKTSE